jgi:geranylgeranyl pyrophosphate synthase
MRVIGLKTLDFPRVLSAMRADLERVEERLLLESEVDYPFVGEFVGGLISAGGKRLRPLILLLAARPFDYDLDALLPAATGVELLHTASLIHDDTVDHAELRRGRPTLNSIFSSETVILLGDYIFARAAMMAAATNNPRVVAVFAATLADICDGQLREIFTAHQLHQTIDDYRRRIFGKTAALFAGSAEMGAIIGRASDEQTAALKTYGGNVGLAFQIVDDVLDLRESTDEIGKPAGLDLRQGTVTLPTMLFFQNGANAAERDLVQRVAGGSGTSEDEVTVAATIIRASGALEQAVEIARSYVEQAKDALTVVPAGEARDMMEALADESIRRTR